MTRLRPELRGVLTGGSGACSDSHAPPSSRSAFNPFATRSSSAARAAERAAAPALAVGDCFDTDQFTPGTSIDLRTVHLAVCTEAHQHEVYAVEHVPDPAGAPFPGDEAVSAFADDRCLAAFEPAIGVGYRQSSLDFAVITPNAESWKQGERSVVCAVHDTNFAS